MKFEIGVIALTLANSVISQSITASYTLIDGSPWSGSEIRGNFSTAQGVFSKSNRPGSRSSHRIIVYNNLIYSFLGFSNPSYNDVWAFNIKDKTWAWMAGNSTSNAPSFGTRADASASNSPGARFNFCGDVHRARGEYVLFGGRTEAGDRGDLWTFNFASNYWAWVAGKSSLYEIPVYNSIGISTDTTTPGARSLATCPVFPPTGEFLLFGGYNGLYWSDMWAFNFGNMKWTWISGPSSPNLVGVSGVKGEWSTGYFPTARATYSDSAFNARSNILYIFGGNSYGVYLNDVWAFKRDGLEWAWIGGSSGVNSAGICGTLGHPGQDYSPGARFLQSTAYHHRSGLLIMFGGSGYSCAGIFGSLSDTWAFNTTSNEWAWIAGSSLSDEISGNYLTLSDQGSSAMTVDVDTSSIFVHGGFGHLSSPAHGYIDYLWLGNISDASIYVSSGISSPVQSPESQPLAHISRAQGSRDLISAFIWTTRRVQKIMTSQLDIFNVDIPILKKLWLIKFQILGVFLVILLLGVYCIAFKYSRRSKINDSATNATVSTTFSSFQTSSTTTSNTGGQTTLGVSTIGVYIPGGLLVSGTLAYKANTELASGGGGSVWLATAFDPELKEYGETVIVKIPNSKLMNDRAVALFYQEIALMNAFKSSRNIAKLLGYSEKPYSTIMKYYRTGSLTKWISSGVRTMRQSLAFMSDISEGVYELHYNGIVHCDLKPDNILIDSGWRLFGVITDFGISRIVTDKLLKVAAYEVQVIKGASLTYAAPEVIRELQGRRSSQKSPSEMMARDIYALGMISSALLNGRNLWK